MRFTRRTLVPPSTLQSSSIDCSWYTITNLFVSRLNWMTFHPETFSEKGPENVISLSSDKLDVDLVINAILCKNNVIKIECVCRRVTTHKKLRIGTLSIIVVYFLLEMAKQTILNKTTSQKWIRLFLYLDFTALKP